MRNATILGLSRQGYSAPELAASFNLAVVTIYIIRCRAKTKIPMQSGQRFLQPGGRGSG